MKPTGRKQAGLRVYVWLNAFEGIVAFILLTSVQSMARNARLLGLSYPRLAMLGADMLLLAVLIAFAIKVSGKPDFRTYVLQTVDGYLATDGRHFGITSLSLSVAIFGVVTIWFLKSSIVSHTDLAYVVFLRVQPLVIWGIAVSSQTFMLMLALWPELWRKAGYLTKVGLIRAGSGLALVFLALGQWAILYFRIDIFSSIKHWYWPFFERQDLHLGCFAVLLFIGLLVGRYVFKSGARPWGRLALIVALGYVVQVGFGYIRGQGFKSLQETYLKSGRPEYAQVVSDPGFSLGDAFDPQGLDGKQAYFIRTKPPGYLLLYGLFQQLINPRYQDQTYSINLGILTAWMSYVFPFLSMLVLPAILWTGNALHIDRETSILAGLYYVISPNVVLLALQMDQVIFPAAAAVCVVMVLSAEHKSSWAGMMAVGALFYLAFFLSFSLSPVLLFILALLSLNALFLKSPSDGIRGTVKFLLAIGAGFLLMYLLFWMVFGYSASATFNHAIEFHKLTKGGIRDLGNLWNALILDYTEFAWWVTLPVSALLVVQLFFSFRRLWRGKAVPLDTFVVAFFITLVGSGLLGMTIGEVARLWMFMMPALVLLVASSLKRLFLRGWIKYTLIISLMVTSLLILRYQLPWL